MNNYQQILTEQLAMNKISWQKLVQNGLTSDHKVQLDFWYYSTNKANAEALKTFLEKETDYEILTEITSNSKWSIKGKTQKTELSLDILNDWVEWMIIAGKEFNCEFDGWGVQL